jgi:hypothetical protein
LYAGLTSYIAGAQIVTTATIGNYTSAASTGTTSTFSINNSTASTGTNTGALTVTGGVGIGGALNVGATSYIAGAQIVTTASISASAVTQLTAGTDTAVSTTTGAIVVWNTSTLQSITNRGATTTNTISITNTTSSTSTATGALTVIGGVGIGGALYVGATSYILGAQIVTTATLNSYGVSQIIAGTDTAVSTSTGVVTISDISTLQSVTNRGSSTTNTISITNTTSSTSTATGALTVIGGVGIGGNLYVGGNSIIGDTRGGSVKNDGNFTSNLVVVGPHNSNVIGGSSDGANTNLYIVSNDTSTTATAIITFGIYDTTSTSRHGGGILVGRDASTPWTGGGTLDIRSYMAFLTRRDTSRDIEAMRIDLNGNLLIGSTISNYVSTSGVYIAGIAQSTSTTTGALVAVGGAGIGGNLNVAGTVTYGNTTLASYTSAVLTSTSPAVLDTFSTSTYRSAKYFCQASSGTAAVHISELSVFHANGVAYINEYGISANAGLLGTYDATISSGNLNITFTPTSVTATVVKLTRFTVTV